MNEGPADHRRAVREFAKISKVSVAKTRANRHGSKTLASGGFLVNTTDFAEEPQSDQVPDRISAGHGVVRVPPTVDGSKLVLTEAHLDKLGDQVSAFVVHVSPEDVPKGLMVFSSSPWETI